MVERHHPWCNFFMQPVEGCWQCKDLNSKFPLGEGETCSTLIDRYFPNVTVVEETKDGNNNG